MEAVIDATVAPFVFKLRQADTGKVFHYCNYPLISSKGNRYKAFISAAKTAARKQSVLHVAATKVNDPAQRAAWNRTHEAIDEFQGYEANWDGAGASPIPGGIIDGAHRYLRINRKKLGAPSFIVPTPEGTITFEWHGDRRMMVEILSAQTAEIVQFEKGRSATINEEEF